VHAFVSVHTLSRKFSLYSFEVQQTEDIQEILPELENTGKAATPYPSYDLMEQRQTTSKRG